MKIDITNLRLDEVSNIVRTMEKIGFDSRIERTDDQFTLVLDHISRRPMGPTPQRLLNW